VAAGHGDLYSERYIKYWVTVIICNKGYLPFTPRNPRRLSSLIHNDNFSVEATAWLVQAIKSKKPPNSAHFIDMIKRTYGKNLGKTEACKWIRSLGFKYSRTKSQIYFDGHERKDVVVYRITYVSKMLEYRAQWMYTYSGPDMTGRSPGSMMTDGGHYYVLVVHDESMMYS
jgi:hypothetical protein